MKKKPDFVTGLLNLGSGFVSACAGLLATVLILYSGYVLYDNLATEARAFSANSDLLKYKPSVLANAQEAISLAKVIPDYRGWITVDDTPIDYPIVQGKDDLYYASHDVYGEASLTGAIYLAAGNRPDFSDSYNLLYGHHMDSGAMFGSLDKYKDKDYFQSHRTATLTTKAGKVYDVTFFAVATTDAYEDQIYAVGNRKDEVTGFLTGDRSADVGLGTEVLIYDKKTAQSATKILALSTCASADTNGRLVVFGRMTEREAPTEEPTTPVPETPTPTPTATPTPTRYGGGGTATATPEKKPVKLTVEFYGEDGRIAPDQVLWYEPGDKYYVVAPQIPGYEAEIEIIRGAIWEDTIIRIHYRAKVWKLTIRYVMADGTVIAAEYTTEIRTGEKYDIESPTVPGYKPLRIRVTGVNPGRNEEYTVIYIPEEMTEYGSIEQYETPLNPGDRCIQIGVCIE